MKKTMIIVLCFSVAGCFESEPDSNNINGKDLYSYYCSECHKDNGAGAFLAGIPANKTTALSKGEISRMIRIGHSEFSSMPHFEKLTKEQADSIATYLLEELK